MVDVFAGVSDGLKGKIVDTWKTMNESEKTHCINQMALSLSIWGSDANNIWAVGDAGSVLVWNGSAWSAHCAGTRHALLSVFAPSPKNVWAVGEAGTIVSFQAEP